jgi:diacylglycerol kinase family enzyme
MPSYDPAPVPGPLHLDPAVPLQIVVNAAAGQLAVEDMRQTMSVVLDEAGRTAHWHVCSPKDLPAMAQAAAVKASASHSAVVAVGGDGTLNTVAQAAHASGCAMGVVPQGTFNYFARTHGLPTDPVQATAVLLRAQAVPVQVGAVNERLFLVNASLGLYPDLLEDREAYKARWGRSRWVAFWAGCATLLRAQHRLRLQIELGGQTREVRALTLFVGNNRLQLQQLGVEDASPVPPPVATRSPDATGGGHITAVMLRPVGTLTMLRLMLRGALGSLGDADDVEHFDFHRMAVRPARLSASRRVKVAFDGEVDRLRAPLEFRVLQRPLYLLKPPDGGTATDATDRADA